VLPQFDYIGPNIEGKDVIIVDSIIDSARNLYDSSFYLKHLGANRIFSYSTHGIFSHESKIFI
jgi:ribose-phosphate pyrophosphokinase